MNTTQPRPPAVTGSATRAARVLLSLVGFVVACATTGPAVRSAGAQSCVPPPTGLIGWWAAENDGSDSAGSNTASLGTTTFASGEVGQAFDLHPDGVTIPHQNAYNPQSPGFTVEFWMRGIHNQPDGTFAMVEKSHCCGLGWAFQGDGGSGVIRFAMGDGSGFPELFGSGDVLDGNFHHVAGTWDGSTMRFYVDAVLQGSTAVSTTGANTGTVNIGYWFYGNRRFVGRIDEVSIYDRALSASEVNYVFLAGSGGKCGPCVGGCAPCGDGIVNPGEQCDDGNTTDGDGCSGTCTAETCYVCVGSPSVCTLTDGTPCDDGLFCNGADTCQGGVCVNHAGDPCPGPDGDGNCAESCDETTDSCTAPDPNGSACNDGLFCNGADQCDGGACTVHTGDPCAGGPECAHTCNEAADNCSDPGTTACTSDGNVCTDDHCNGAGVCIHTNNTAPCTDGLFCNGADTCSGGGCNTHAGNPCTGGPVCAQTCNEAADNCFATAGTGCTSDGNPCTLDQCNGSGTCTHPAGNAGTVCRASAGPCDVAETCTGTSPTCPANGFQPDNTPCNDANACTTGDHCIAGACTSSGVTVCDPCEVCTPAGGCVLPTAPGCQPSLAGGKSSVSLKDGGVSAPDKDSLKWKWKSSAAVATDDFGDPTTTTDLTLCVIDQNGLKISATAPAGGTCGTKPCWSVIPAKKIKYSDKELSPDGLQKVQAQAGDPGKGKIQVKGKGANLGVPTLGLVAPVTVRLVRSGGPACWEATYSTNVQLNTSDKFKAKSD